MILEISDIPDKYDNLALMFSCQSCTRTGSKHRSHSRLTSWHVVTMQWVSCKPVLMGDNKSLLNMSEKTKHDLRKFNLLQVHNKSNQNRIEEWFQIYLVTTLSKSKSRPYVKLFCPVEVLMRSKLFMKGV